MKDLFNKITGRLHIKVYEKGKLILEDEGSNMVVDAAKDVITAYLKNGATGQEIVNIGVGTDGTDPTPSDTGLTDQDEYALDSINLPGTPGKIEFLFTIEEGEANGLPGGQIAEFGLFCADGTMFARKVRSAILKTSSIRLEGTWVIQF